MEESKIAEKSRFDYLVILFLTLITHGFLFLSEGIFWDDWLWYTSLTSKNHFLIYQAAIERGIPTDYYFQLLFTLSPNVILNQRLTVFLLILLNSFTLYRICLESGVLGRTESILLTTITISYPAFQTWILIITSQYIFYYFLFLLGTLISIKMAKSTSYTKIGFRIMSLMLFFISFGLNSLLVFYFGFLVLLFAVSETEKTPRINILINFLAKHIDYIILPFAYWIIKNVAFPQYGLYANYNKITLSLSQTPLFIWYFLYNGIYIQISSAILLIIQLPILWMLSLLAAIAIFGVIKLNKLPVVSDNNHTIYTLLFGFLLLGLSILPYVAVGVYPSVHGWSTRHSLLLSLPIGLIFVSLLQLVLKKPNGFIQWIGCLFIIIILVGFIAMTINQYVGWQQRWIKDKSVMMELSQMDQAKKYSVFWVEDKLPAGWGEAYRFYEWSSIFKETWKDEKWVGLPTDKYGEWFLTNGDVYQYQSYNMNNFDPFGCQAVLLIRRGPLSFDSFSTLLHYYYYRFLQPNRMNSFLENITRITIKPYTSNIAIHCHHSIPSPIIK